MSDIMNKKVINTENIFTGFCNHKITLFHYRVYNAKSK